ncbi:nonsense-mediated mRNA decay factor SMG9 isoform X2 [Rhynchophorus ferrugineus]|uniref:nonsense-mediated mRNA decay factor SMG9 isoform X2 n=1 Tax=Rhynchophorus ferrugineus TaxID=354439 RepID=UPI003FCE259D
MDGSTSTKTFSNRGASTPSKENNTNSGEMKQPTILLKNRENTNEENTVNIKKKPRENEQTLNSGSKDSEAVPILKHMKKSMKLIEDGIISTEHLQDYLQENNDFLVVGIVGGQGVGKSTLLNLLAEKVITDDFKQLLFKQSKESLEDFDNINLLSQQLEETHIEDDFIFRTQTIENIENCTNCTQGIDIYVSPNRVIFLDCQPFLSVAVLDDLIKSENKRANLVSEFIPLENSGEIQGLQYTSFLMSVCHILIVVQDWFFDSNVVRFIQTAEMLKPTISNTEDEYTEHFPHLIMLHNKAQLSDFTPKQFKSMQKTYEILFQKTKLQFHSNLGLGTGRIINTLDPENCGKPVNLFLIPDLSGDSIDDIYCGHPSLDQLIKRLRANLFGALKNPLTHIQLTEKTWLVYCNKAWDTVKKSPFFVEYTKLMP